MRPRHKHRDWERASYRMPFPEFAARVFLCLLVAATVGMIARECYLVYNGYYFYDGVVLNKHFVPAHQEMRVGEDQIVFVDVPDKWYFLLQKPIGDELCRREIEVTKEAFDHFGVGTYYPYSPELKE